MWIKQAGYADFCYALSNIAHPLSACENRKSFKIYMSDTGMLNSILGIDFVPEFGNDLIAVEVKSGMNRKSPSPDKVKTFFGQVNRRVKLSDTDIFKDAKGVEHYPLSAACFIDHPAPEYDGPKFFVSSE